MKATISDLNFFRLNIFLTQPICFLYHLQCIPLELYKILHYNLDLSFFVSIILIFVFRIIKCVKQLILLN